MNFSKFSICCLLLVILLTKAAWSQDNSKLDSLQSLIEQASDDSTKLNLYAQQIEILTYSNTEGVKSVIASALKLTTQLNDPEIVLSGLDVIGQFYYNTSQLDSSLAVYMRSLNLANNSGLNSRVSGSLIWIGNVYNRKGNYDSAIHYHSENISFCKSVNDQEGIASSYNNLGNIANARGDYAKSIEHYTQALKTYEKLGDDLSTAIVLANMGMVLNRLENYDKAIGYLKDSDVLFQKLNDQVGINFVLKNLGVSYKNKGDLTQAMKTYRKAQFNYLKMNAQFDLAGLHQNIGNVYWEWGEYDSARINYFKSLEYAQAINDALGIARAYNAIGACYLKASQFEESKTYAQKAKEIAELAQNPLIKMNAEEQLYSAHKMLGEYKDAVSSLERFNSIKDSLRSSEKEQIASEVEAKYQNEKKQKEIALLKARNEINLLNIKKKENELIFLIVLVLAALVLGAVLYRLYKISKKSTRKLQELNQMQSSFFANISHEFRTPLTLIMASLDKLRNGSEASKADVHDTVNRNSKRLLELINQLLDLSKLEAGSEQLMVRKVDVNQYMKRLSASFTSLAESRSIAYEVNISEKPLEGFLDTDKIEKVIYNILSNAFKFTSEGGKVIFAVKSVNQKVQVEICDNGIGIAETDQEHVFRRFYQADKSESRMYDGSGVGLALTRELLELHKGTIVVSSKSGHGSKFTVTIPLTGYRTESIVSDEVQSIEPNIDQPVPKKLSQNINDETKEDTFVIELVEDNEELQAYLKELLDSHYQIITATNGACGYDLAQEHIPDLIITDLMMPKVDGKEMIELIRSNEKTSHIPVFMLTAKADRKSKLQGLETGADDYLTKPFDTAELQIKIANVLKNREKMQERLKEHFYFPDPKLSANDRFIKKASEIINDNLSDPDFNVEEFNRAMGYSRMQLHRKLKALTGKSTGNFIKSIRMKKALLLLEKDYDQISQIAFETGFSSPSYFSKCFKQVYGVTPKEYIQKEMVE